MIIRCTKTPSFVILICLVVILCYALFSLRFVENPLSDPGPEKVAPFRDTPVNVDVGASVKTFKYQEKTQDDPELVAYIKTLLRPPSPNAYMLKSPDRKHFTAMEQSKFVGDLYGPGKREGFFVEVGALDGETSSSTLYLERELGFSGLLIEPNPTNYNSLLRKNRKAYTINAALSPTTKAEELLFTGSGQQGHLASVKSSQTIEVKAFPFYAILQALNIKFIDVFNLDIEGFEFKVMKTIPWDKVKLGIMIVEHLNIPEPHEEVVKFMENLGYVKIHQNSFDYIFADPNYLQKLKDSRQ